MPDPPQPRRRFQFRLRTLLIGVTLLAVACEGAVFYRRFCRERKYADELYAKWQNAKDMLAQGDNYSVYPRIVAARNWCLAECAVPFSDHAATCRRYYDWVLLEIDSARGLTPKAVALDRYTQEAEKWLSARMATGKPEDLSWRDD